LPRFYYRERRTICRRLILSYFCDFLHISFGLLLLLSAAAAAGVVVVVVVVVGGGAGLGVGVVTFLDSKLNFLNHWV
jgi:hypothetical protein